MSISCGPRLEVVAVGHLPLFRAGDDLAAAVKDGLARDGLTLRNGDVVVVASKAVSRAEGRFVDLATVEPSERARELAGATGKDPRWVELVLRDSTGISRQGPGALVVRHKLGFVSADAGIDMSNARPSPEPPGSGPWVLLLPEDPDRSAEALRASLAEASGARIGVVVSDSFGRPFRLGTVGGAIGVAGPAGALGQEGRARSLRAPTRAHAHRARRPGRRRGRPRRRPGIGAARGRRRARPELQRGNARRVRARTAARQGPLRMTRAWKSVVALSGGVGGARLIRGLARALPPEALTTVVNTGDDFEHWGLHVSPDVDTVMYALAGLSHEERGWGLADETFRALEALRAYGEEGWFAIGDRDLATHMARTLGMARGETLTQATARLCAALGIASRVLPMSDGRRPTMIDTRDHGSLTFQNWFVRHRAEPAALRVWFDGTAGTTPEVLDAVRRAEVVIVGPSNPYVSIDPILTLPGVHEAIFSRSGGPARRGGEPDRPRAGHQGAARDHDPRARRRCPLGGGDRRALRPLRRAGRSGRRAGRRVRRPAHPRGADHHAQPRRQRGPRPRRPRLRRGARSRERVTRNGAREGICSFPRPLPVNFSFLLAVRSLHRASRS